jgi:putative metallohydrolase (TIGR04338 family)
MATRLGVVQAAVYAAEEEALSPAGVRWRRIGEAQRYAEALVEREWFAARWPEFGRLHVERRSSGARYSTCADLDGSALTPTGRPTAAVVLLAPGHLTQAVLLHEVAHVLAAGDDGHGPGFLAAQLELVRHEMGLMVWAAYRAALASRPELAALTAEALRLSLGSPN